MRALPVLSILCATTTLMLMGCAGTSEPPLAVDTPSASGEPTETPSTQDQIDPDDDRSAGPVEAYLDWLAASREPDAARACSLMSDELQKRMISEFSTSLGVDFPGCEAMIIATADMYSAVGASAEVNVTVVSETATEATLFATYVDSGKCGTIHLSSTGSGWILTEQSEECAR